MKILKIRTVYYSGNNCNPFVRNAIRSAMLSRHIYVRFVKSSKTAGASASRETETADLIRRIAKDEHTDRLLQDDDAINALQKMAGSKKDIRECMSAVLHYLYPSEENRGSGDNAYVSLWNKIYGGSPRFIIRDQTHVNSVNYKETRTYLKLFEEQKRNFTDMENATDTLLQTIPCDVDTIADIGSGPGLVNQYIPYCYKVLAVDLNEEILRQNHCDTCIGDILDLPLADRSVDLTISCDVLEHIEPDKLDLAVSELQRVSRKYIYIQVPFNEILRYSLAKCPECGNVWHVNFHKNVFDLEALKQYERKGWKICQVNYTGQVYNESEYASVYKKIEEENSEIYRVEGFECPECGAKSTTVNLDALNDMEYVISARPESKEIHPRYTEIGVLFQREKRLSAWFDKCRKRFKAAVGKMPETADDGNGIPHTGAEDEYSNCHIDFTRTFVVNETYTGKEQIPVVIGDMDHIRKTDSGIYLPCGEEPVLRAAFPFGAADKVMEIQGQCERQTELKIVGVDREKEEFLETQTILPEGSFCYRHKMDERWMDISTLVKLYADADITVSDIRFETPEERKYHVFTQQFVDNNHYEIEKDGIKYLYYIPADGVAVEIENSYKGGDNSHE